ncbi:peptidoglycan-binding protein, partial [Streptomyces sp. wa1063]|uniref:peptidoglycan-binding domain-containing protein n=1 Tax=Streptomyces sp. wa1063 TaxID=1828212 RepID=UPI0035A0A4C3
LPKTSTERDGVPGPNMWKRTQNWLRIQSGYTGPTDGVPGPNTYAALQRNMAGNWGYTGPIDGNPGPMTWSAVQRLAAQHGYTGPIDGVMGPNSWRGFSHFINADAWDRFLRIGWSSVRRRRRSMRGGRRLSRAPGPVADAGKPLEGPS